MNIEGIHVSSQELIRLRLNAHSIGLKSYRSAVVTELGLQHSRMRGRGVEFLESRIYQPGDDIRNMDWKVTARTGKPHTKVYREERERPVIVMIDFNSSMFFGTRVAFKSVIAARLAALIGWAATHNGDRIGAFLFGGTAHQEVVPAGGHRGPLRLIRQLVDWCNRHDDLEVDRTIYPWSEALQRLQRVTRPGSLIFLLSDFYHMNDDSNSYLTKLRQHNDIVACQIIDVLEQMPPPPGRYAISDGQAIRILDTRMQRSFKQYQNHFTQQHNRIKAQMRKHTIPLVLLTTRDNIVETLRKGLASRTQRK